MTSASNFQLPSWVKKLPSWIKKGEKYVRVDNYTATIDSEIRKHITCSDIVTDDQLTHADFNSISVATRPTSHMLIEKSPQAKLKSSLLAGITRSEKPVSYARDAIRAHNLPFPNKIVLFADGNGRWARQQQPPLPISEGHRKGADAIISLLRECYPLAGDIESIAVWVVSPDNIAKRDSREIQALRDLTQWHLQTLYPELQEANARFIHLGSKEGLPPLLGDALTYTEEVTRDNTGVKIALGFNYNADQEDYDSVVRVMNTGRRVTKEEWLALRDPHGLGQADLVVRPGGEQRLSNMGWIVGNGELVFSPILMPDYTSKDFAKSFVEYAFRQRRGGGRPPFE